MRTENWLIEFFGRCRAHMFKIKKTIVSTQSRFQNILIADVDHFGKALFLDGVPQSAALDEHIYHETLIHPALVANGRPKKVFLAGGGEGAVVRETLKHNSVEKVLMIDIDDIMVDMAREHLYEWHQGAFDDPRVELKHEDARGYLATTNEKFDCIIMDLTDPFEGSPSAGLFTLDFYNIVKSRLNEGGVFAAQAEHALMGEQYAHVSIIKTLKQVFKYVMPYYTMIYFYRVIWGFVLASDSPLPEIMTPAHVDATVGNLNAGLKFYDGETHTNLFSAPKYLRDDLNNTDFGMIISDSRLLNLPKPGSCNI
ncbi:MAG: polyamine aminopropyltransferase [Deltaproteobacteria bacterium]|nr:polyamine aminopropyltransferase [Deltaproteobacteria bacterium]